MRATPGRRELPRVVAPVRGAAQAVVPDRITLVQNLLKVRTFDDRKICHASPKLYGGFVKRSGLPSCLTSQMKRFLPFVLPFTIAVLVTSRPAETMGPVEDRGDKAIVHVLNRIAFGPRPGDVERVRAIGIDRYIDQQLHPQRVADPGMAPRVNGLASIGMSSREIAREYELP